jgi:Possible tRNA binding domain
VLVLLGLQRRELSAAAAALQLPTSQVLALFGKSMKRFAALLKRSEEGAIERAVPRVDAAQVRMQFLSSLWVPSQSDNAPCGQAAASELS